MGTVPTPSTFTAGQTSGVAAGLNANRDAINFLLSPPRAYCYPGLAQTLTTATYAPVAMGSEVYDVVQSGDTPQHDTATNTSRIYCRTTGKYMLTGQVSFAGNNNGGRQVNVRKNAAGVQSSGTSLLIATQATVQGGGSTVVSFQIEVDLTAGDYVEMFAYQSSGGNLNINNGIDTTFMQTRWTGS